MHHLLASLPPQLSPDDASLNEAVQRQYALKSGVHATRIQVSVRQGIVCLRGFTDNLLSLQRAEELAKAVAGVRGVLNELRMRTADVPDAQLQRQVAQALTGVPGALQQVQAAVHQGEVKLTGVVDSWVVKQWVGRAVRQVVGVWRVKDQLACTATPQPVTDPELAFYLNDQLAWDAHLRADGIAVQVQRGRVHLRGAVDSDCTRSRLVATAWAAGAAQVDTEQLQVGLWAVAQPKSPRQRIPDEACVQAILDTWQLDPRLGPDLPALAVRNGVATLSGAVSTLQARRAAEQDAQAAAGIWHVHNHLRVWPRRLPDDAELCNSLHAAQAQDTYVNAVPVEWAVANGRAILLGCAPGHFEQQRLEELAESIPGVLTVVNHLHLQARADPTVPPRLAQLPALAH
ncbi:BON domain-containing protein [Hymenobacter sp. CRA2]|uniref:BON domain-containing protein n=1 Tax=Hymenobacter sp. CRA2 TaxID=1955620 RepID=UPI00098F3D6F|nr:BON domain-containing protein [Hymenobacter sp. CRA2]OON69950.1 hypothetical protein B0919_04155 [Hymenobacter sp. CRA2]